MIKVIRSHLFLEQISPVVERVGQKRVLRAERLFQDRLAPLVEWLSIGVLALKRGTRCGSSLQ